MKVGKWWVEPGILASGRDPAPSLQGANWPDDYTPSLFMMGDGHRRPAFRWATRGGWENVFGQLIEINKVVCHVETFADSVTADRVPNSFAAVFQRGKVFGWEPEVYRVMLPVLGKIVELTMDLHMNRPITKANLQFLSDGMRGVANLGYLRLAADQAKTYWDTGRLQAKDPVPLDLLAGIYDFVRSYEQMAMLMRTQIHNVIGAHLQRLIERYPDHMHLIAVGDAHVMENPLYGYIQPPVGTFGIADESGDII